MKGFAVKVLKLKFSPAEIFISSETQKITEESH
jgi:hypothetical protein